MDTRVNSSMFEFLITGSFFLYGSCQDEPWLLENSRGARIIQLSTVLQILHLAAIYQLHLQFHL